MISLRTVLHDNFSSQMENPSSSTGKQFPETQDSRVSSLTISWDLDAMNGDLDGLKKRFSKHLQNQLSLC